MNQVDSAKVVGMEEKRIETLSCFSLYFIGCFCQRGKTRRYKRMLKKAQSKLGHELDLARFVKR